MIEKATWIWAGDCPYKKDLHAYFRQRIPLRAHVESAFIEITAGDHYQLFCNGKKLGEGPSPATPHAYYYDRYEMDPASLTDNLCIFIHAYAIGQARMVTCQNQALPGVLFAVKLRYMDGEETVVSSRCCKAITPPEYFHDYIEYDEARISKWGGFEEVYLSPRSDGDAACPEYDDSGWQQAQELPQAWQTYKQLLPREIQPLRYAVVWPETVLQVEPYLGEVHDAANMLRDDETFAQIIASRPQSYPSVVLDFGRQVVGHPVFDLCGSKGASMRVQYGESLDMMRMDTLILSGTRQKYRPYQRRAFRYMRLTFNNSLQPVRVYRISMETERYPFDCKGAFSCSDSLLNDIYNTSIFTVQQNAQEHFEDCVMREKMQWLADARVMSLVAYWNFGDPDLSRKAIRQFFRIQREDGLIPAAGPQAMDSPNVDFAEHFVLMVHEYWSYTGDTAFVKEYLPQLRRLMGFFAALEDGDGLLDSSKAKDAGLFLDWAWIDKREKVAIINCMYCDVLRRFAELLQAAGQADAGLYVQKAGQLAAHIREIFWDAKQKLFVDCVGSFGKSEHFSEQSNLCAVFSHVLSPENSREMLERVLKQGLPDEAEKIRGAFYLSLALQGVFEHGHAREGLERMKGFWGEMLRRGATTWWETFDPDTPGSSIPDLFSANSATSYIPYIPCSHCHGWGAGPAYLLPRFVLGVEPVEPGFHKVRIRPQVAGLEWAKGKVCTPHGAIEVEWKREATGEIRISAQLPQGVERVE